MPYHSSTQNRALAASDNSLEQRLLHVATELDFSVIRIAACTGATRQTVYQWFRGRSVSAAYLPQVEKLLRILETAKTAEKAWSIACKKFNLTA